MSGFLERMNTHLRGTFPSGGRTAYSLTNHNALPKDWFAQTPDIWGKAADDVHPGQNGKRIVEQVRELVASAKNRIDLTTLAQFPDGQFLKGLQQGLVALAKHNKSRVTVRILAGYPPVIAQAKQSTWLKGLIEPLKPITDAKLEIYAAAQRTGTSNITWNHAKIVAVDGEAALVGGENLWTGDYLESAPVHDLNVRLEGPAVHAMHSFANVIWQEVCGYRSPAWKPAFWKTGLDKVTTGCLPDINSGHPKSPPRGSIQVLGVGRYGRLKSGEMNPTDDAFVWAIDQAKNKVCLSQQDLLGPAGVGTWTAGVEALCRAIERKCHVQILVSNHKARSGSGNPYSNTWGSSPKETYEAVARHAHEPSLVGDYLHVASLRFGPSDQWSDGKKFANHAKFAMIDDSAFYVGSCNFYPSDLIEYGVFLEDSAAVAHVLDAYWRPLWTYSERTLYHP